MRKTLAIIGVLIPLIFVLGFMVLFIVNPKTYEELNNVSLATYNIEQMDFRLWAAILIYFFVGLLNIAFCVALFLYTPNRSVVLIGKILLLVAGLAWFSLGVFPYDPTSDISFHLLMTRVVLVILTSSLGLLFIGGELEAIVKSKFLKTYTLSSGLLIMLLGFLSAFVYNDTTWIRTNTSFLIYFLWFGVIGALFLFERKVDSTS